jgi:arylsulfate sulfotransferase
MNRFFLALLFISLFACNEDLKNEFNDLKQEVEKLKTANSILELKNFINQYKSEESLIVQIIDNPDVSKMIFENGQVIEYSSYLVVAHELNNENWIVNFTFSDSSTAQAFMLGTEIGIDTVKRNVYGISPLTALAQITTPVNGKFKITVKGADGADSDISRTSEYYGKDHEVEIVGMYPGSKNNIEIVFTDKNGHERLTKNITLQTDPLPSTFPEFVPVVQYTTPQPNTLFLIEHSPLNTPLMVDRFGKVRWYSNGFTAVGKYALQILKNGNVCFGQAGKGQGNIYEYTLLGQLIQKYSFYPQYENAHHDVYEMPNGNFLVLADKVGINTIEDHVIELHRSSGTISQVWDLRQILPMDRYTFRKIGDGSDWFHANAVIYSEVDHSIIISGQAQGLVKVSWDNKLEWILSDPTGWAPQYQPYLLVPEANQTSFDYTWGQHAPLLLPNKNLLVFDNGFGRHYSQNNKYSRGVEYKITQNENRIGGSIRQEWEFGKEQGISMFSSFISDIDYIQSSDTRLLTAGAIGFSHTYIDALNNSVADNGKLERVRILEVDKEKNILFDLIIKSSVPRASSYRAEKIKL